MFGGGYPPGAEHDPRAPYNQEEPPERDFDVTVCQSLSKQTTVTSQSYYIERDEECPDVIKTIDVNWEKEYSNQHFTPLELIEEFKKCLENETIIGMNHRYKQRLIEECSNWVEDETEVIEE